MSPRASLIGAAGCAVYVTVAAVFETIGYKMLSAGWGRSLYRTEVAAEEFLEMLGASLILHAVLLLSCLTKKHKVNRGDEDLRLPSISPGLILREGNYRQMALHSGSRLSS